MIADWLSGSDIRSTWSTSEIYLISRPMTNRRQRMKSFEQRWREMPIHPGSPAFQRVDESHPVDFYIGKEASGEWVLLLITDERPRPSREYRTIHVITRERQDGRWALVFRLMSSELERVFSL